MTATATDNTTFIARYLQALSGKAKTPAIVAELVTDPGLIAHIRDVEAAFPEYELEAEEVSPSGIWWRCEGRSAASTAALSPASRRRAAPSRRR